jgi:hypothetical protein
MPISRQLISDSPPRALLWVALLGLYLKKFSEDTMRHNLRTAIRIKFGTQLACGHSAGIHPIKLNRLCCGWAEPTSVERERLAVSLQADPDWLFSTHVRIPRPAAEELVATA